MAISRLGNTPSSKILQKKLLAETFKNKAKIYKDKWTRLSNSSKRKSKTLSSFFLPASSDGFGFKFYKNESDYPVVIKLIGKIRNARISKPNQIRF